jgi:outer membrane translocation and assembly module TamA
MIRVRDTLVSLAPTAALCAAGLGLVTVLPAAGQETAAGGEPLRVASVAITGLEAMTPDVRLPRRLPLRVGGPYTGERVAATEALVLQALAERGHPFGEVEITAVVDHVARTAAITLAVEPGPRALFGEIRVQADPPLRESDIRARIRYAPGDVFRPSAVEETRRTILALPGVDSVAVDAPGVMAGAEVIPTVVRVTRPERMAGVGVRGTLSSFECLQVNATWRHQHFLGRPAALSVSGGFSNLFASVVDGGFPCAAAGEGPYAQANYFLTADYMRPIVAYPATAIQGRAFFRRRTAPQAYVVHGYGLHVAALREVRPHMTLRTAYSPERNELRAAGHYFCVHFAACSADAMDALEGMRWLAPLEVSVSWLPPAALQPFGGPGTREAGLWPGSLGPLWRSMARAGVAGAAGPTGSDFAYLRGVAEGSLARVTSPRTEIAARIRVGALGAGGDMVPPQVRFYSGGANTVRGAPQNLLGPLVLVARSADAEAAGCEPVPGGCPPDATPTPDRVSVRPLGGEEVLEVNLEGRLWVTPSLQLAAFADAGVLQGGLGEAAPRRVGMVAPGVGIRWLMRLGPVRVDLGYDPRPPRRVPMLLQDQGAAGLVRLGDVIWAPHTHDDPGGWTELWRRLQIHLAVGQPF